MAAYLVCSLISGFAFALTSFLGFDAGLWAMTLWYVAGCWTGFAASLALFLLVGSGQKPPMPHWPEGSAVR